MLILPHQVMDELLPKATGKEARIEKKKIEREKKRARQTSPGNKMHMLNYCHVMVVRIEVSDTFLMGSR